MAHRAGLPQIGGRHEALQRLTLRERLRAELGVEPRLVVEKVGRLSAEPHVPVVAIAFLHAVGMRLARRAGGAARVVGNIGRELRNHLGEHLVVDGVNTIVGRVLDREHFVFVVAAEERQARVAAEAHHDVDRLELGLLEKGFGLGIDAARIGKVVPQKEAELVAQIVERCVLDDPSPHTRRQFTPPLMRRSM